MVFLGSKVGSRARLEVLKILTETTSNNMLREKSNDWKRKGGKQKWRRRVYTRRWPGRKSASWREEEEDGDDEEDEDDSAFGDDDDEEYEFED
mgnify:CR=1 FL=1